MSRLGLAPPLRLEAAKARKRPLAPFNRPRTAAPRCHSNDEPLLQDSAAFS